jgi:hypothetical protein
MDERMVERMERGVWNFFGTRKEARKEGGFRCEYG